MTAPESDLMPLSLDNSKRAAVLTVAWNDGSVQQLPNALLRRRCRCTECESARRAGAPAPVADGVVIEQINLIGSYGVQFVFSDCHERGIYPWQYLRGIGSEEVVQS
jgi:DUF971 family protein